MKNEKFRWISALAEIIFLSAPCEVANDSPVYPPLARGGGTVGAGGVVASDSDRRYVSSKTKKFSSLDKV